MIRQGFYRGSGLLFRSDIALSEYIPAEPGPPDVCIETGHSASEAASRAEPQTWEYDGFQASPDGPVLVVPDIASYLVTGGRHIAVSPITGGDPGMVKLYLMGSAIGMLFHQRGQLILHGAAVAHASGVTLFTGPSGAGKSTLAAHLAARGNAVLGDDTLPLFADNVGVPTAWPGARMFKLCTDAAETLPDTTTWSIAGAYEKVFARNAAPAPEQPLPLRDIVLLERGEGAPKLTPVEGLQAVALIAQNTYRPEYLRLINAESRHFEQIAALTAHVRTWRLIRPWDAAKVPETLDMLEAHWRDPA
ncbi:MAG: hypothetical protein AB8B85_20900 [Paracoccaceae bacterium]